MTSAEPKTLEQFLKQRMNDGQISATTLVFTFFCDVVTQHGGEMWLGNVIRALAPLDINERLTRTAVFRLVRDGWLESRKQGRRSYYRLSPTGKSNYQRAAKRIYTSGNPAWDGAWTLVFTAMITDEKRDALNRGLLWLGYGRIAKKVFALPRHPDAALGELLADLGLEHDVVCMRSETDDTDGIRTLVTASWKLDELRERYGIFTRQYHEALKIVQNNKQANAQALLLLRVLLIHEYRKILLNDPELPMKMLPAEWEAPIAQNLTAKLYRQLAMPTSLWVHHELLETGDTETPVIDILATRFNHPVS